jgi:Flp pilus assembly protein TadD
MANYTGDAMRTVFMLALCLCAIAGTMSAQAPQTDPQESSSRAQPDAPPSPPDAPVPDQGAQTSPPPKSKAGKIASKFDPHCINVIFHTCWSSPPESAPRHLSEEEQKERTVSQDIEVGYFYLNEKNYRAAASRLQEATELRPDAAAAWVGLAQAQQKLGQSEAARDSYEHYLKLNPDSASAEKARKALASLQQSKP